MTHMDSLTTLDLYFSNEEEDLAKTVINVTKSKSTIKHFPALEEGDMTRRKPEISKMMSVLGRDLTKLEEGIKMTIKYIQEGE